MPTVYKYSNCGTQKNTIQYIVHLWGPKKPAVCKVSSVHQAVKAAKAHVQATWSHVLKTKHCFKHETATAVSAFL